MLAPQSQLWTPNTCMDSALAVTAMPANPAATTIALVNESHRVAMGASSVTTRACRAGQLPRQFGSPQTPEPRRHFRNRVMSPASTSSSVSSRAKVHCWLV